ncbi:MAG: GNAT family N-acetyltransferase [Bacillota bacterium]|nr:GNAT family N-acetyltransferase [Bacillota bacterium]
MVFISTSSLYRLTKEDIPKAVACLKDAFKDDPLWAEVFKHEPDRDKALSGFFTTPLLYGMKFGKVYATSSEIEGVAVWVPGKHANMSVWGMLRCGALSYGMKMGKESMSNLSIVSKQLGPDRNRLMKNKPYKYLTIIGVCSLVQGKGLGSKIMDTIKEECTREGLHLYLETESEENLSFYEKHGFTLLQKIVFKKINMPMWQMMRKPQ